MQIISPKIWVIRGLVNLYQQLQQQTECCGTCILLDQSEPKDCEIQGMLMAS